MDSKTQALGVAHDVRNVLARAMLRAERLAGHDDPAISANGSAICDALQAAADICTEEMSVQPTKHRVVPQNSRAIESLVAAVARLVSLDRQSAAQPAEITADIEPDVIVACHRPTLLRILYNLCDNAVKAAPADRPLLIRISAMRSGKRIVFAVADNGVGLPDSVLARMFPDVRDMLHQSGTLSAGLMLCGYLTSMLDGELRLTQTGRTGTTYELALPAYLSANDRDPKADCTPERTPEPTPEDRVAPKCTSDDVPNDTERRPFSRRAHPALA